MIYQLINKFGERFYSLRYIPKKNSISLDLKLPINWSYESILMDYSAGIICNIQDEKENFRLISLVCDFGQYSCDELLECGSKIVKFNLEQEEKSKLFEQKVNELRELFLKTPLDKLKDIDINGQETSTSERMVGQRNKKRQPRDRNTQEKNDTGNIKHEQI